MKESILDVKNLSIQYHTDLETVYAVNNISFSLAAGETLGLVGETGAGKTSTALGILGLLPKRTARVTSGEVIFNGQDLLKLSEKDMLAIRGVKISMIFQDPMTALNPVIKVGDQISFEGYADDFNTAISAVEFSLDGGATWTSYKTANASSRLWVYWNFDYVTEAPGTYRLDVRARAADGTVSPLASSVVFTVEEAVNTSAAI